MEILTPLSSFPSSLQIPTFLSSSSKSSSFLNPNPNAFFRPVNPTGSGSGSGSGLGLRVHSRPTRKRGVCTNSLFGLGVPELAVIAGVVVLVFGPKKLPEVGRSFGKTIKSFQQAAKEFEQELKKPGDPESSEDVIEAQFSSESLEEKDNVVSSSKESS